jgi:hypothetical protein
LPFQLPSPAAGEDLRELLTDVSFVEAKIRWGGADRGAATDRETAAFDRRLRGPGGAARGPGERGIGLVRAVARGQVPVNLLSVAADGLLDLWRLTDGTPIAVPPLGAALRSWLSSERALGWESWVTGRLVHLARLRIPVSQATPAGSVGLGRVLGR